MVNKVVPHADLEKKRYLARNEQQSPTAMRMLNWIQPH